MRRTLALITLLSMTAAPMFPGDALPRRSAQDPNQDPNQGQVQSQDQMQGNQDQNQNQNYSNDQNNQNNSNVGYENFSSEQLDNLLSPIALYPDPLLAQVFVAATFPDQVEEAARFVRGNGTNGVDNQDWDVSVRSVAHYPTVIEMMADKIDWTTSLGQAYVNQSTDVSTSVQRLRHLAKNVGNLQTNQQQEVLENQNYIAINPIQPQYIYVPVYDPAICYYRRPYWGPAITFGTGYAIGAWLNLGFRWGYYGGGYGGVYYTGWRQGGWGGPGGGCWNCGWIDRGRGRFYTQNNVYINNRYNNVTINRTVINRTVNVNNINRYNYVHKNVNYNNVQVNNQRANRAAYVSRPNQQNNRPGQNAGNNNRPGQNGGNNGFRPGQQNGNNRPGQNGQNGNTVRPAVQPGQNAGNRPGQNGNNRPGQNGNNRPGQNGADRPSTLPATRPAPTNKMLDRNINNNGNSRVNDFRGRDNAARPAVTQPQTRPAQQNRPAPQQTRPTPQARPAQQMPQQPHAFGRSEGNFNANQSSQRGQQSRAQAQQARPQPQARQQAAPRQQAPRQQQAPQQRQGGRKP